MENKARELIKLGVVVADANNDYYKLRNELEKEGCIIQDNDLTSIEVDDTPMKNRLAAKEAEAEELEALKIKKG